MTYQRLPYEDAATTPEMISDCAAVGRALPPAPGHVDDGPAAFPRQGHDEIVVPDHLAELAADLHLHLG